MSDKLIHLIEDNYILIKFERAINDLRKGLPIIFDNKYIIFACESLEQPMLDAIHSQTKTIIIDKNRAKKININADQAIGFDINIVSLEYINSLISDLNFTNNLDNYKENPDYELILEIIRLAQLIPSALILHYTSHNNQLININHNDIKIYKQLVGNNYHKICTAPLNLTDAKKAKMVAFRPKIGGQEHYAIIVGDLKPNSIPYVRVHSSCYTGDLIGSLSCDCGEQLRSTIKFMGKNSKNPGVIIYLMQEGRGIGLTNKLRTYIFQNAGLDTVEANLALGFSDDSRNFEAAAKILKNLDISTVKLITNNPKKIDQLKEYGIKITETIPLITETARKSKYFKTKIEKLGHLAKL